MGHRVPGNQGVRATVGGVTSGFVGGAAWLSACSQGKVWLGPQSRGLAQVWVSTSFHGEKAVRLAPPQGGLRMRPAPCRGGALRSELCCSICGLDPFS